MQYNLLKEITNMYLPLPPDWTTTYIGVRVTSLLLSYSEAGYLEIRSYRIDDKNQYAFVRPTFKGLVKVLQDLKTD